MGGTPPRLMMPPALTLTVWAERPPGSRSHATTTAAIRALETPRNAIFGNRFMGEESSWIAAGQVELDCILVVPSRISYSWPSAGYGEESEIRPVGIRRAISLACPD